MRAVGNRVVVRNVNRNSMTAGGVAIPENLRGIPDQGVVTHVGRGGIDEDGALVPITDVKVGDWVLFERRKGQILRQTDGVEARMVKHEDVVAVFDVGEKAWVLCEGCHGAGVVQHPHPEE